MVAPGWAHVLWGIAMVVPSLPMPLFAIPLLVIGAFRLTRPTSMLPGGWKVRRSWERWGPLPFMTVFGSFLGLGFVTTITSPVFLVLITWAFVSPSLVATLVVFLGFAAGRITTSMVSAIGDAPTDSDRARTIDRVRGRILHAGYVEGLIAIALGAAIFGVTLV